MEKLGNILADYMKPYKERTAPGANLCEKECDKYLSSIDGVYYQKFGFDETNQKIPSQFFFKIPKLIRNCPDFIVIGKKVSFVECKGCKGNLKVKLDDLDSYKFWNMMCPLFFFILLRTDDEMKKKILSYDKLMLIIENNNLEKEVYPDNGKEYYKIPFSSL
tara:strand:+ start:1408 stop:1893 length:486 start_codon:yes stop_codon:yes gene_type:complete